MFDGLLLLILIVHIYIIITVIFLILDNREPASTFAWVFIFIIIPVGGLALYFLIGRNWRIKGRKRRLKYCQLTEEIKSLCKPHTNSQAQYLKALKDSSSPNYKNKLFNLLYHSSDSLLTINNRIRLYFSGKSKFSDLKADLENAEKFIHMEYYIWRNDSLTRQIQDILLRKVSQGVEIRILYDAIGSLGLRGYYLKRMRRAGIEIYPYYDFLSPLTIHTLNYRNHRKIAVIDGKIGYTGGMNMGKEYVDGGRRFDSWYDTHVRLEGESVGVLNSVFATSWVNTTKTNLFNPSYFPKPEQTYGFLPVQITTSGPDSQWGTIRQLYFSLISSAERSIFIRTPYFIPDQSIFTALETAALSGLDVKIILAGKPDKKLPFWAAKTYFQRLLQSGVKLYYYQKGFMHSKAVVVDDYVSSIGSANMDIRSFRLNYEVNTLIYDKNISGQVSKSFIDDLAECKEFSLSECERTKLLFRFRNSLARLFAPLL